MGTSNDILNGFIITCFLIGILVIIEFVIILHLTFKLYFQKHSNIKNICTETVTILCFITCIIVGICDGLHCYFSNYYGYDMFTIQYPINIFMFIADVGTLIAYLFLGFIWYLRVYLPFKNTIYAVTFSYQIVYVILNILAAGSFILYVILFLTMNSVSNDDDDVYQLKKPQRFDLFIATAFMLCISGSLLYLLVSKLASIYRDTKKIIIKKYAKLENNNNNYNSLIYDASLNTTLNTSNHNGSDISTDDDFRNKFAGDNYSITLDSSCNPTIKAVGYLDTTDLTYVITRQTLLGFISIIFQVGLGFGAAIVYVSHNYSLTNISSFIIYFCRNLSLLMNMISLCLSYKMNSFIYAKLCLLCHVSCWNCCMKCVDK